MADGIRNRLADVIHKEYTNSSFEDVNHDAYYVWAAYDWWIIPWFDILADNFSRTAGVGGSTEPYE